MLAGREGRPFAPHGHSRPRPRPSDSLVRTGLGALHNESGTTVWCGGWRWNFSGGTESNLRNGENHRRKTIPEIGRVFKSTIILAPFHGSAFFLPMNQNPPGKKFLLLPNGLEVSVACWPENAFQDGTGVRLGAPITFHCDLCFTSAPRRNTCSLTVSAGSATLKQAETEPFLTETKLPRPSVSTTKLCFSGRVLFWRMESSFRYGFNQFLHEFFMRFYRTEPRVSVAHALLLFFGLNNCPRISKCASIIFLLKFPTYRWKLGDHQISPVRTSKTGPLADILFPKNGS